LFSQRNPATRGEERGCGSPIDLKSQPLRRFFDVFSAVRSTQGPPPGLCTVAVEGKNPGDILELSGRFSLNVFTQVLFAVPDGIAIRALRAEGDHLTEVSRLPRRQEAFLSLCSRPPCVGVFKESSQAPSLSAPSVLAVGILNAFFIGF
jgi:hypothetical protein